MNSKKYLSAVVIAIGMCVLFPLRGQALFTDEDRCIKACQKGDIDCVKKCLTKG